MTGSDSPAIAVAEELGIEVLQLSGDSNEPAGFFSLNVANIRSEPLEPLCGDRVALVLHTSGTTARPKQVPLTQANLLASANHIAATLQLSPEDRCLNVMPLFHIHGLVAAVLASLHAGASVVCTPGFQAPCFFDWMKASQPSWYTAVPTMHQAILLQSAIRSVAEMPSGLRFVRSSSSPLAPSVMKELEQLFHVPVIEAYGMTEAAHQMTCNPLPPLERKPGTVGLAAGPEVAIMNENGDLLPHGNVGEVVIRGANVTSGYVKNPEANAVSFTGGWFRTGDQGVISSDGYLSLTGRLKEIINRGGEKISPREIDEVLLQHPAVAQAIAFAYPDSRLGEDIAVALVLRDGYTVAEDEIRSFAASRLAPFKVPRVILSMAEIPNGPTGKLQRVGLAEKLGVRTPETSRGEREIQGPPNTAVEKLLATIWAEVLGLNAVCRTDNFLELGGDSILMVQVHARIRDRLGLELPFAELFNAPTLAHQDVLVEDKLLESP
jgi:acyl-CoA synthetase (AMP-forming)/AMP-acid ligase II/aryl carrier-like protein